MSSLAELAEDIEVLLPLSPDTVKVELPDCVLLDQAGFSFPPAGGAHRLRFDAGRVEQRIEAVRTWFRERGRNEFTWWIGTSATPGDIDARLRARGAVPYEEGVITSMVATEPPPEAEGVEVRKVEQFDDFVLAREIAWVTAGFTDEQSREARGTLTQKWEQRQRTGNGAAYIAYVDGEPVAAGDIVFLPFAGFLSGAGTRPEYRGRGAFRALVRARWDEAARRGTPTLFVGAGKMSRPILERIGFEPLAEVKVLLDRSGLSS